MSDFTINLRGNEIEIVKGTNDNECGENYSFVINKHYTEGQSTQSLLVPMADNGGKASVTFPIANVVKLEDPTDTPLQKVARLLEADPRVEGPVYHVKLGSSGLLVWLPSQDPREVERGVAGQYCQQNISFCLGPRFSVDKAIRGIVLAHSWSLEKLRGHEVLKPILPHSLGVDRPDEPESHKRDTPLQKVARLLEADPRVKGPVYHWGASKREGSLYWMASDDLRELGRGASGHLMTQNVKYCLSDQFTVNRTITNAVMATMDLPTLIGHEVMRFTQDPPKERPKLDMREGFAKTKGYKVSSKRFKAILKEMGRPMQESKRFKEIGRDLHTSQGGV